jgi:uncharacterized membrane protein YozB (DUF420 family)
MPQILVLLFLGIAVCFVPMATCCLLAWFDAKRQRRQLLLRVLTVASVLTVTFFVLMMSVLSVKSSSQTNWNLHDMMEICIVDLVLMFISSFFGALGYSITFRLCKFPAPDTSHSALSLGDITKESKNPYQSPRR